MSLRLARWMAVAALGFGVQTLVLLLLVHAADLHYLPAMVLAVTSAIVHNFLWHERWTWADRAADDPGTRLARFARFTSLAALVSLAGGLALTALLVEWLHVPLALANLATVAVLGLVNFAGADRLAFTAARRPRTVNRARQDLRGVLAAGVQDLPRLRGMVLKTVRKSRGSPWLPTCDLRSGGARRGCR